MSFLDFKYYIRDSEAINNKLILSTDHYLVKMTITLKHYESNSTTTKLKPTQPATNNTTPSKMASKNKQVS
jgi:hypothetical protein